MSFHKCKGIKVIRDLAEVSWPGKRTPPGLLGNRAKWRHQGPTGDYWSWGFTAAGSEPLGCLATSRHLLVFTREWASSLSHQSPPISRVQATRETWDWVLSLVCPATGKEPGGTPRRVNHCPHLCRSMGGAPAWEVKPLSCRHTHWARFPLHS